MAEIDLSALRKELPGEAIVELDADGAYAVDGLSPRAVVVPESVEQVAAIVRWATAHDVAVWPRGGGSKQQYGGIPSRAGVVLGLERLTRVVDHVPGDLTVTMQAGLRLKELQEHLMASRQWLPIDPPFVDETTIGGILATASAGSRRLLHGSMRDLVLGVTMVLADGTVARAGGRVVKNVTGYDLNKLYIGSHGTLGVLVECTCKLKPRPLHESVLMVMVASVADACEALRRIRASYLMPAALDLLNPPSLALLAERANLEPAGQSYGLLIGLEGTRQEIDRCVREVSATHVRGLSSEWIMMDGADVTMVWNIVQDFPKIFANLGAAYCLAAAHVPFSELAEFIRASEEELRSAGFAPFLYAHAGNGEARIATAYSQETMERLAGCMERARQRAINAGGSLVIERAEADFKRRCDVWGEAGSALAIMQALKTQYDPAGILNPGRFVGGI